MLSLPGHLAILVEVRLGLDNLLDLPGIVAALGRLDRLGYRDCPLVVLQGPPDRLGRRDCLKVCLQGPPDLLGRRDCLKVVLVVLGCPPDRLGCKDCPRVVLQGPPDCLGRRDCLKVVLVVLDFPPDRRHCPSLGGLVGQHCAAGRVGFPAPRILAAVTGRLESSSLLAESDIDWKRCKILCLILV